MTLVGWLVSGLKRQINWLDAACSGIGVLPSQNPRVTTVCKADKEGGNTVGTKAH